MPTLDQAARQLGISEKTLRRWMRLIEPPIEPTKHRYDMRYRLISPEDVQRIREERATLPQPTPAHAVLSSYNTHTFDRRDSTQGTVRDPRPARPHGAAALPDGMMARSEAAARHGMLRALTTLRRWCDDGWVECDAGSYGGERGQFSIHKPITRRGLAQLYTLASGRSDFLACPDCPHSE